MGTAEEPRREVSDGGSLMAAGDWWLSFCSQGMWLIEVGGGRVTREGLSGLKESGARWGLLTVSFRGALGGRGGMEGNVL